MLICPNPECPHRIKTGKPAEYVEGMTTCSDCGSELSVVSPVADEGGGGPAFTDLYKRILFTLAIVVLYRLTAFVPVAGLDLTALGDFLKEKVSDFDSIFKMFPAVSLMGLSIMPYMTAYMLVEILALFTPPLKSWRRGGNDGRRKLKITALVVTMLIAMMQGYGIARSVEFMGDAQMVLEPGLSFRFMMALTLTAGTFLAVWFAELITSRGIGHGISVLFLSGILARGIPFYLPRFKEYYREHTLLCFAAMILLVFALFAAVLYIEKSYREITVRLRDGRHVAMPFKFTTAGIVPQMWTSNLIFIPASIAVFVSASWVQQIAAMIMPGTALYNILFGVILFMFYYLFTSLFYHPEKIESYLNRHQASIAVPDDRKVGAYVDRILHPMALLGFVYLYFMIELPMILNELTSFTMFISGIGLITATAITIDIFEEFKVRRSSEKLVKIGESHDIVKAGFVKNILWSGGIPCHLRGYYHRALLYFFGPYIEVSLLVPVDRVEDARELIGKYMNEDYCQ